MWRHHVLAGGRGARDDVTLSLVRRAANIRLELLLRGEGGLGELHENVEALTDIRSELRLHGARSHATQPGDLPLELLSRLVGPLALKIELLLEARRLVSEAASRGRARLSHILLHVLVAAELIAHSAISLLLVGRAVFARLLVEVAHGRPAARAGLVRPANGGGLQVDVTKGDHRVVSKRLHHTVPCRCLLDSSASPLAGDEAHKESLARVDRVHDHIFVVVLRHLHGIVPMRVGVDAARDE
mmetsp:Transcript_70860/g.140457  ORF Transcript_70860/g.140457 Transcript_70860/m.140457 type:complete len:243 (+) Transcript_70860:286-1014(+)